MADTKVSTGMPLSPASLDALAGKAWELQLETERITLRMEELKGGLLPVPPFPIADADAKSLAALKKELKEDEKAVAGAEKRKEETAILLRRKEKLAKQCGDMEKDIDALLGKQPSRSGKPNFIIEMLRREDEKLCKKLGEISTRLHEIRLENIRANMAPKRKEKLEGQISEIERRYGISQQRELLALTQKKAEFERIIVETKAVLETGSIKPVPEAEKEGSVAGKPKLTFKQFLEKARKPVAEEKVPAKAETVRPSAAIEKQTAEGPGQSLPLAEKMRIGAEVDASEGMQRINALEFPQGIIAPGPALEQAKPLLLSADGQPDGKFERVAPFAERTSHDGEPDNTEERIDAALGTLSSDKEKEETMPAERGALPAEKEILPAAKDKVPVPAEKETPPAEIESGEIPLPKPGTGLRLSDSQNTLYELLESEDSPGKSNVPDAADADSKFLLSLLKEPAPMKKPRPEPIVKKGTAFIGEESDMQKMLDRLLDDVPPTGEVDEILFQYEIRNAPSEPISFEEPSFESSYDDVKIEDGKFTAKFTFATPFSGDSEGPSLAEEPPKKRAPTREIPAKTVILGDDAALEKKNDDAELMRMVIHEYLKNNPIKGNGKKPDVLDTADKKTVPGEQQLRINWSVLSGF